MGNKQCQFQGYLDIYRDKIFASSLDHPAEVWIDGDYFLLICRHI